MALSWTMDKLGPLSLTADDCGIALENMAGYDPSDPSTTKEKFIYEDKALSRRLRLGVIRDVAKDAQPPVRDNFTQSLKALEMIADIEEVTLQDLPYESMSRTIINAESASAFEELIENGKIMELTDPSNRLGGYTRMFIPAVDYLKALRIRGIAAEIVDKTMEGFDAWIAPSRPTVAPPIDRDFRGVFSPGGDIMGGVGNGLGLPSISVPNGFSEQGLPTGIQFMGRAYSENSVLAAANAYQAITDWHNQHPDSLMPSDT
jgi:aspartyl-tRNA(Asn)/glutamyl-tRNA(Gln) amidotransferase subunit A